MSHADDLWIVKANQNIFIQEATIHILNIGKTGAQWDLLDPPFSEFDIICSNIFVDQLTKTEHKKTDTWV